MGNGNSHLKFLLIIKFCMIFVVGLYRYMRSLLINFKFFV